jgi:hypothetical protein
MKTGQYDVPVSKFEVRHDLNEMLVASENSPDCSSRVDLAIHNGRCHCCPPMQREQQARADADL